MFGRLSVIASRVRSPICDHVVFGRRAGVRGARERRRDEDGREQLGYGDGSELPALRVGGAERDL